MSYEERQWPGAFSLPMLYTKGIDRGFWNSPFQALHIALVGGYWNRT